MYGENLTEKELDEQIFNDGELAYTCDKDYVGGQYHGFLLKSLMGIPLFNLWDICYLFARDMAEAHTVPDISGIDLKKLEVAVESNSDDLQGFLTIIQNWLSSELTKSIDRKEIKPVIIGRFLEGNIDTKRTFVHNYQIDQWLTCRNIYVNAHYKVILPDYFGLLDVIIENILKVTRLLEVKIYNPDYIIPEDINSVAPCFIVTKNEKNGAQLSHKNSHGNTEKHAKKREEILGAALSVLANWPEQCKNNAGVIQATKIRKLIEEKAPLFWKETREPPLSTDKIEREISQWIKKAAK